jgi:hypothetical protein
VLVVRQSKVKTMGMRVATLYLAVSLQLVVVVVRVTLTLAVLVVLAAAQLFIPKLAAQEHLVKVIMVVELQQMITFALAVVEVALALLVIMEE